MMVLLRRLVQILVILAVLSFALFGLLSAMPGDPVDMLITSNPRIKPEDVVRLKKLRGLDQPWYFQYVRWIWGYNDPKRPPTVSDATTAPVAMLEGKSYDAKIDIKRALADADFVHTEASYLEVVSKLDSAVGQQLKAAAAEPMPDDKDRFLYLGEKLYDLSPQVHSKTSKELANIAASKLEVTGLFGAKASQSEITQTFDKPGEQRIWFTVKDNDGLEAVGSVAVFLSPFLEPTITPQGETPEEDQLQAGGTEGTEPAAITEPTRDDILAAAKAATTFLRFDPIGSKVVDQPEDFAVFLADSVKGVSDEEKKALSFKLLAGSPGNIDAEGVYKHIFDKPGQSAIQVEVSHPQKGSAKGAFSVEHGPIPDENKFNNGFLWVFAGDKEALGFSNTYKRPVWELLAGVQTICGDGLQGAGETCDDYNTIDGDGCSSTCHDESLTAMQKFDANAAGAIIKSGRVINTIQLMLPAILLSLLIAIPLGVLCAYRQYSWVDYISNFFAFVGISLPVFWFAIMVLAILAEKLQWLPAGGIQDTDLNTGSFAEVLLDRIKHTIMPALVLSIAYTGRWLRYMRGSMLEVLPLDFIRTARAKGLSEKVVILKHALRNALIPVVTVLALSIPALFGGALLTETVFAWPGIGRLQYDSVMNNDYYVAIVVFLISSALLMLGNLLADFMYVVVDPRIRKN